MKSKILVLSVAPYEIDDDVKGKVIGKTAFYTMGNNSHPIKQNCNIENELYEKINKTGIYDATFTIGSNSKSQSKLVLNDVVLSKPYDVSCLLG